MVEIKPYIHFSRRARGILGAGDAHELLDVRTPSEYASAHVPGARLIPLNELKVETFLAQHKPGTPIYVLCQAGARASKAIEQFERAGCGDCDIRFWADLLKQLQPIPHFPAHLPGSKPVPSFKLFKFPALDAIPEQA